ncbi:unnamed protein product [Mytilus edulis]|uniref:C2H2-type domain-containing protein n=1 Tax=Mytilus edulis TaxID=6550 RepID=A0A8S3SK52_MYTED|nr:unnamed protein product [Mytilus edulis]
MGVKAASLSYSYFDRYFDTTLSTLSFNCWKSSLDGKNEAQSDKSYCDAKIAHMRQKMRIFSAEGHNITTAMQMKEAIDSGAGVKGVYTSVVDVDTTKHQLKTHSWKGVSFITNVEYTTSGIKTWKAYRIGDGCLIENNKIISDDFQDHESSGHINLKQGTSAEVHEHHVLSNQTAFANAQSSLSSNHANEQSSSSSNHANEQSSSSSNHANEQSSSSSNHSIEQHIPESSSCTTVLEELDTSLQEHEGNNVDNVFYCPEYGCTKPYQSFEKMQDHIFIGKHTKQLFNDSTCDRAKQIWAGQCETLHASTLWKANGVKILNSVDLDSASSLNVFCQYVFRCFVTRDFHFNLREEFLKVDESEAVHTLTGFLELTTGYKLVVQTNQNLQNEIKTTRPLLKFELNVDYNNTIPPSDTEMSHINDTSVLEDLNENVHAMQTFENWILRHMDKGMNATHEYVYVETQVGHAKDVRDVGIYTEGIKDDDSKVKFYTGFPTIKVFWLFFLTLTKHGAKELNYWEGVKRSMGDKLYNQRKKKVFTTNR